MALVKIFLAGLVGAWAQTCANYTCKSPKFSIDPSTCAYFDRSALTWYLNPCDHGYVCEPLDPNPASYANYSCMWSSPEMEPQVYPGEACYYDSDCFYSDLKGLGCVEEVCEGKEPGSACDESLECNPGLACLGNSCQQQVKAGGMCSSDYDCHNTLGCDKAQGAGQGSCVKYFGVEEGGTVKGCPGPQVNGLPTQANVNILCESGSCVTDSEKGESICVAALRSNGTLPMNCTQTLQCISSNSSFGGNVVSSCGTCGHNSDNKTYCALFPGDPLFQKLISATEDWLSSSALQKCNTERRFSCMSSWSGYSQWAYYYQATINYAQVVGAESCVVEVLFPAYYAAEQANTAGWVGAALVFFSVL